MLIGAEGTRLLRKSVARGDPAGAQRRGGSRTARGKRVAAAEINTNFRKGLFQCPLREVRCFQVKESAIIKDPLSYFRRTLPCIFFKLSAKKVKIVIS